jgi:hypothetical protein
VGQRQQARFEQQLLCADRFGLVLIETQRQPGDTGFLQEVVEAIRLLPGCAIGLHIALRIPEDLSQLVIESVQHRLLDRVVQVGRRGGQIETQTDLVGVGQFVQVGEDGRELQLVTPFVGQILQA